MDILEKGSTWQKWVIFQNHSLIEKEGELNMSNYTTKSDSKNATDVDKSRFAKAWFPLWVNVRKLFFIASYPKWKHLSKIISQNCHLLNRIKLCNSLILKSNLFDSKLKLSQGLILAQREPII